MQRDINGGDFNLGGTRFFVDEAGFIFKGSPANIYNGEISSRLGMVRMHSARNNWGADILYAPIVDDGDSKVGLALTTAQGTHGSFRTEGDESNTYTGDTTVTGDIHYNLGKTKGAIAVRGKISAIDGAQLKTHATRQFAETASVHLISRGNKPESILSLNGSYQGWYNRDLEERFSELVVEGKGVLDFGPRDTAAQHGQRWVYLDDLVIGNNSHLRVLSWAEGRDHLLVRKNSKHLQDALNKMHFEGYDRNAIHLENFNKDYWQISGAPEPATYGAGLMLGIIGFVGYRRRRKRFPLSPRHATTNTTCARRAR